MQHWLSHWLGMDGSDTTAAWGGFLSCLGYLGIIGTMLRRHQCEVGGCRRIVRHTTDGGHKVCTRHMPGGAPTARQVVDKHEGAQR
jgi:hypothetical protein